MSPSLVNSTKYPSYCKSEDGGKQEMKGTTRQTKPTTENHTDISSIRRAPYAVVGFGVETDVCRQLLSARTSNCASKDHRDKIKVSDPVVKDLISSKL